MAQPIDPRQLRPRRRWYGIAVFIAVLFTAIGIGGFVVGIVSATDALPDFDATYTGNQDSQIQLQGGKRYSIFVPENQPQTCNVDERVTTSSPSGTFSFSRDGHQWVQITNLKADTAGAYSVNCDAQTYAVGPSPELGQFAGGIGGGLAALLGLPCVGLTTGGIIALVTGLRRSSHRKQLQSAPYVQGPYAY